VPNVSLSVLANTGVTVLAAGGTVHLPQRQICAWAYFGTERWMRQAVIDTGAPASILPFRIWDGLNQRGDIAWIGAAPPAVPAGGAPHVTVFGGRYPFWLGRVRLELVDSGGGGLPARDVLAICTDDPQTVAPPLRLPLVVGLADVMNGRSLLLRVSADGQQWTAVLSEP
jgi:hypothetical protein